MTAGADGGRPSGGAPRPLPALAAGASATIVRIVSSDPGRLVKMSSLGLMPGAKVRLLQKLPAIVLQIGETTVALDRDVAATILIDPA